MRPSINRFNSSISLVLFLTRGSSLEVWKQAGILSREIQLYEKLVGRGVNVTFVTYGKRQELEYASLIPQIRIVCNLWSLPSKMYIRLLPLLLFFWVGRNWIGKSNQCLGADIGLNVARGKHKFIARNGYLFSLNEERSHGIESAEAKKAIALEYRVFAYSNKIVVTTDEMKKEIIERHHIDGRKIAIIPNYVDTNHFSPASTTPDKEFSICYVGRLVANKNPLSLVEAIQGLDVRLLMVGSGPLAESLQRMADSQKTKLTRVGMVPNAELPSMLRGCDLFVNPSLYEGHPKALIEAMACGLPVIATDVPGNRELIRHNVDGFLCGSSPAELRRAILDLKENPALRRRLGEEARRRVVDQFSLDRVVELEMNLLEEVSRS